MNVINVREMQYDTWLQVRESKCCRRRLGSAGRTRRSTWRCGSRAGSRCRRRWARGSRRATWRRGRGRRARAAAPRARVRSRAHSGKRRAPWGPRSTGASSAAFARPEFPQSRRRRKKRRSRCACHSSSLQTVSQDLLVLVCINSLVWCENLHKTNVTLLIIRVAISYLEKLKEILPEILL